MAQLYPSPPFIYANQTKCVTLISIYLHAHMGQNAITHSIKYYQICQSPTSPATCHISPQLSNKRTIQIFRSTTTTGIGVERWRDPLDLDS